MLDKIYFQLDDECDVTRRGPELTWKRSMHDLIIAAGEPRPGSRFGHVEGSSSGLPRLTVAVTILPLACGGAERLNRCRRRAFGPRLPLHTLFFLVDSTRCGWTDGRVVSGVVDKEKRTIRCAFRTEISGSELHGVVVLTEAG